MVLEEIFEDEYAHGAKLKSKIIKEMLDLDDVCCHDTVAYLNLYVSTHTDPEYRQRVFQVFECIRCNEKIVTDTKTSPYMGTDYTVQKGGLSYPVWAKPKL